MVRQAPRWRWLRHQLVVEIGESGKQAEHFRRSRVATNLDSGYLRNAPATAATAPLQGPA